MMGAQIPACEHSTPRQRKGVPAEYAGLCDCCLITYQISHGILFCGSRAAEREAGQ
jgi:hypothetical protein